MIKAISIIYSMAVIATSAVGGSEQTTSLVEYEQLIAMMKTDGLMFVALDGLTLPHRVSVAELRQTEYRGALKKLGILFVGKGLYDDWSFESYTYRNGPIHSGRGIILRPDMASSILVPSLDGLSAPDCESAVLYIKKIKDDWYEYIYFYDTDAPGVFKVDTESEKTSGVRAE